MKTYIGLARYCRIIFDDVALSASFIVRGSISLDVCITKNNCFN